MTVPSAFVCVRMRVCARVTTHQTVTRVPTLTRIAFTHRLARPLRLLDRPDAAQIFARSLLCCDGNQRGSGARGRVLAVYTAAPAREHDSERGLGQRHLARRERVRPERPLVGPSP
jgi:hypothetical protein